MRLKKIVTENKVEFNLKIKSSQLYRIRFDTIQVPIYVVNILINQLKTQSCIDNNYFIKLHFW